MADIVTRNSIASVVYVPFLPEDEEHADVDPAVWDHFRSLDALHLLGKKLGVALIPLWSSFYPPIKRSAYFKEVLQLVRSAGSPRLVLLDPDTGLEPATAGRPHVKLSEVRMVWEALAPLDWLAVYQHRCRDKDWNRQLKEGKSRLERCLQGTAQVGIERRNGVVTDAAVLLAKRN